MKKFFSILFLSTSTLFAMYHDEVPQTLQFKQATWEMRKELVNLDTLLHRLPQKKFEAQMDQKYVVTNFLDAVILHCDILDANNDKENDYLRNQRLRSAREALAKAKENLNIYKAEFKEQLSKL